MSAGLANTPLINYFFYKQSTTISGSDNEPCFPILSIADGGNGQLVITTNDTSTLTTGVGVTITGTTSYNGNYTVISLTPTTFNVSGTFGVTETGCWELAANMTGANAGDPLDFGEIFFYNATNTTVLQDTFSDRDLTIPNTNPLVLDANGAAPVIYMGNPTGVDEPYYIEIYDKFNNLVATLENYFPGEDVSPSSAELPIENLLPNYGFDTKINGNIYSQVSLPPSGTNPVTLGWYWQIETSQPDPNNTYEYIELGNTSLDGNPKNELRIRSTNNTTGQSTNNLFAVLGTYNMFQDQQLTFVVYTQLLAGTTTTIPVNLIRTRQMVEETPINVGSINITPAQTQRTLTFTVPPLTLSDYDNNDELRLVLQLPLNEDLQHSYTGTWCQLSPDGQFQITETAIGTRSAKQWFGNGAGQIAQEDQYQIRGLPASVGDNGFLVLAKTGTIFQGGATQNSIDQYAPFAASMVANGDVSEAPILVRDEIIGNTQTNRLIDYLRLNGYTQSRNTFIATSLGNVVSVELGIGAVENSAWVSNAVPDITVAKPTDELIYALSAIPFGNGNLRFTTTQTFPINGSGIAQPFSPLYAGDGSPVYQTLPPNSPILSWVGRTSWVTQANSENIFEEFLSSTIINPGSSTEAAIVDFKFRANGLASHSIQSVQEGGGVDNLISDIKRIDSLYEGFTQGYREFFNSPVGSNTQIQEGFLSYNDDGDSVTQGEQPPRVINFGGVNNAGIYGPPRDGATSTAVVLLDVDDNAPTVARKISEVINTSWVYEITIPAVPTNGQTVDISTNSQDLIVIYWDTDSFPVRPANTTPARKPIYVQFSPSTQTVNDIADATRDALNNGVMGVPRAADLGFYFSDNTQYYMIL